MHAFRPHFKDSYMTKSSNKSQRTASKLEGETGIDDDMLSGVVGGAGGPSAALSKPTNSPDEHLNVLDNVLHVNAVEGVHHGVVVTPKNIRWRQACARMPPATFICKKSMSDWDLG